MFVKKSKSSKQHNRILSNKGGKKSGLSYKTRIKNHKFKLMFVDVLKWLFIDIYRAFKYPRVIHLYGIRCVVGMYGMGKTMSMSWLALGYRLKYGNDVLICSNYGLLIQDFPFTNINQVAESYDKPIIFLWDEVQNDFPSTDRVFPKAIRKAFSLNRKGKGKMYYWASQDHELVHKTIRRLTIEYGQVKTILKRYTRIKWFTKLDYESLTTKLDVGKRMKIHPIRVQKFVQDDYIRSIYDSFGEDNGEKLLHDENSIDEDIKIVQL